MLAAIFLLLCALPAHPQSSPLTFTTLNCYWFFNEQGELGEPPRNSREYDQKTGHLVGLLPAAPPLFVAPQEIGGARDVARLAHAASERYKRPYASIFVQGKDCATKQDVAALLDTSRGWGVYGKASRASELERDLSKHLVVRLTNASARIDVAVVQPSRPRGEEGRESQREREGGGRIAPFCAGPCSTLPRAPKANVVIMGDFSGGEAVGSPKQALAPLFAAQPPMVDAFAHLKGKAVTHASGAALDRVLISDGLFRGSSGLRFAGVAIQRHNHGKGEQRRLWTDRFPVSIELIAR